MARKKISVRPQPPRARPVGGKAPARTAKAKAVRKPKKASKKQAERAGAIIESNRKTELCRNWINGTCAFGARCAFAHGVDDIKHKTLRELEKEGRLDASKHHSSLCMTWVSTGACPYGKGCVFIHDPRATGPAEATLRPPPNLEKISNTSSKTGSSKLLCADGGDRDNLLSFPDIPRDPDSIELPADKEWYDLHLNHAYGGSRNLSAVFKVWYSYVSTIVELNVQAITGTPILDMIADIDTDNNSLSNAAPISTPRRPEPLPTATAARVSYKDAATRSVAVSHSPTKTAGGAASADGGAAKGVKTSWVSFAAAGTTPATATAASPPAVPSRLQRLEGLREMKITRPMDSVKHLPVFEGLCKGKTPGTLPVAEAALALGQDGAVAAVAVDGGEEGAAPSPAPSSSSSVYYSPTSSPVGGAAPPSLFDSTTAAAAGNVIQVEGDSYFSCPSSPARSTVSAVVLKPPPGFEGVRRSTAADGWSSASTDAASWTSSGVSSEHDDDDDDDGFEDHRGFDFLQQLGEPLRDPWAPAAVASDGRGPITKGRLPFFASLHSEDDTTSTGTSITSNDPSTGLAASGDGGVFYLLLPGGGGSDGGDYNHGEHMTASDSRRISASEYDNGGEFARLDDPVGTGFAPSKAVRGHPVSHLAGQHCQPYYADTAKHNTWNSHAKGGFF